MRVSAYLRSMNTQKYKSQLQELLNDYDIELIGVKIECDIKMDSIELIGVKIKCDIKLDKNIIDVKKS